jgi:hypothetical protein
MLLDYRINTEFLIKLEEVPRTLPNVKINLWRGNNEQNKSFCVKQIILNGRHYRQQKVLVVQHLQEIT